MAASRRETKGWNALGRQIISPSAGVSVTCPPAPKSMKHVRVQTHTFLQWIISLVFSQKHKFLQLNILQKKTSVFTACFNSGSIWELDFFKYTSCYDNFGTILNAPFRNADFYNDLCLLFGQAEVNTYLCSKHIIFTMNYAHLFKNNSFYNEKHHPLQTSPAGCWLGWLRKFCHCFRFFPQALLDGCSKQWLRAKGKRKGGTPSAGKS